MTKLTKVAAAITALAASAGFSTAAHANCSPGFFADLACQLGVIDEETANTLDQVNANTGQQFDKAGYAFLDTILPGAGTVAGTYAGMQQQGGRGAPAPAGYPSAPMMQPSYPTAPSGYNPYAQPQYQQYQTPQVQYVYNCYTPQGVFNFGQPLIAGSPCYSMTAYGTFYGTAGR